MAQFTRRGLLFSGVAAAGAVAVGTTAGCASGSSAASSTPAEGQLVAFTGTHQAGITTPAQDRLHFVALDLTSTSRGDLIDLLKTWTETSQRLTAGHDAGPIGAVNGSLLAAPDDTGEALGLPASRLTITVGLGESIFDKRFGLADRRPPALAALPAFPGDALDTDRSDGDLCIQACADDPQVAVHAIRNLVRLAHGTAQVRWSQLGFGRTSSTSSDQSTPRNLFGFKDGTANLKSDQQSLLDKHVWVQPGDGPAWMNGGSYLVSRRIRMHIETWDTTGLGEQERVIGRSKGAGAPLGATGEFDALPAALAATKNGEPVIDPKSHVRLANPLQNGGAVLLRRGYSFVDGSDGLGHLDAGLFFLAYQRDPRTHFVRVQNSLAGKFNDAMNEYIQHTSSGLFAIPPGITAAKDWYARELFA